MDGNISTERPDGAHYPRSWIAVMFAGERLNKLRIVYSDESEQGAIVVVAAVMLNMDTHWKKLEADFDRLPEGWRNRREVKGNKLFRDLRSNRGPESETALRILCSIPAARQVEIFSGAVDRNALHTRMANRSHYYRLLRSTLQHLYFFPTIIHRREMGHLRIWIVSNLGLWNLFYTNVNRGIYDSTCLAIQRHTSSNLSSGGRSPSSFRGDQDSSVEVFGRGSHRIQEEIRSPTTIRV